MYYYKIALSIAALCAVLALSCRERVPSPVAQASPAAAKAAVVADTSLVITVYPVGDRGFGYTLCQSGKKVVDQPNIPAIQHSLAFSTRKEAEITAQLVKQKLQAHQFPPTITIQELDSLHIHYY